MVVFDNHNDRVTSEHLGVYKCKGEQPTELKFSPATPYKTVKLLPGFVIYCAQHSVTLHCQQFALKIFSLGLKKKNQQCTLARESADRSQT